MATSCSNGHPVTEYDRYCRTCGVAVGSSAPNEGSTATPPSLDEVGEPAAVYAASHAVSVWPVVVWLVVFFPAGLYLMWRRAVWSRTARALVTAAFAVVLVGAVAVGSTARPKPLPGGFSALETPFGTDASPSEDVTLSPTPSVAPLSPSARATLAASSTSACRTDPLANVYHPDRLEARAKCIAVRGSVVKVIHEQDGDYHIDVRVDAQWTSLLNSYNNSAQGGSLVVEIVPADEPGCIIGQPPKPASGTYNYGLCTGANIFTPPVGSRIEVTGPYVIDHQHGWAEIHPAWKIATLSGAPAPVSGPASSVRITSISPNPVNPGQYITLAASTEPNAACNITVTYASGTVSKASGLVAKNADSAGHVSWTWKVGTSTHAGRATATVGCGSTTATTTFDVT